MLKGVSFLPRPKSGVPAATNHDYEAEEKQLAAIVQPYAQMPYERISGRQYSEMRSGLGKPAFHGGAGGEVEDGPPPDLFCDADGCEVPVK